MKMMDQPFGDVCPSSEDDDEELSETEQRELEIALYSQIHYDQNENLVEQCNKTEEEIDTVMKYNFSSHEPIKDKKDVQKIKTKVLEKPLQEVVCISSEDSDELSVLKTDFPSHKNENGNFIEGKNKSSMAPSQPHLNFIPIEESFDSKIGSQIDKESPICIETSSSSSTCSTSSDFDSSEIDNDFDSDCMVLDEDLSDTDGIQLHVDKHQERLLKKRSPEEDKKWEIVDEDKFGKSPSPVNSRYYRGDARRCYNCREIGHTAQDCKKPQKSQICHMCGFVGHFYGACPQKMCYSCERPGHAAKDCDQSKRRSVYTLCYRCRMYGHFVERCPDVWRQYHMTTDKDNPYKGDDKENPLKFCSNCAEEGHFGYECEEERFDRHSLPVYPFVARYDNRGKFQPANQRKRKKDIDPKSGAQPKRMKMDKDKIEKDEGTKTLENEIKSNFSVSVNFIKGNSKRCVTVVDHTDEEKPKKTSKKKKKNKSAKKSYFVNSEVLSDESKSVNFKTAKQYKWTNKKDKTDKKKTDKKKTKKIDIDEPFPRSMNKSKVNSSNQQSFIRQHHQGPKTTNSKTSAFHNKNLCDPSLTEKYTSKKKQQRNFMKKGKGKKADKNQYTSSRGFKSSFVLS